MVQRHTFFCILLCSVIVVQGCASFKPVATVPVHIPPDPDTLTITPVEGRPQSVLLRIQWVGSETFTHMILYRVVPDADPLPLHTLQYSPQVLEQLQQGVVISDPTVHIGPITYAALMMHNDRTLEAAQVDFIWTQAPAAPSVSFAIVNQQVVLNWTSNEHHGAVVFRRDLLTEEGLVRIADLQPSHHGFFIDSNVAPEGVYAYRVALMETPTVNDGPHTFPRFGSPSEEVYVTVDNRPIETPLEEPENPEGTP